MFYCSVKKSFRKPKQLTQLIQWFEYGLLSPILSEVKSTIAIQAVTNPDLVKLIDGQIQKNPDLTKRIKVLLAEMKSREQN